MGINVSIITDHPEITIENLPLCAALAVSNGMDQSTAMSAITYTAAKNSRIDDRVGSLEVGKDADIAIFTGIPTDFNSKCLMTFVDGTLAYK